MRFRAFAAVVALLAIGPSCSRDPEVVKRRYLESGNRYFDKGQYKEASIMYRQALRKDLRYGEAYHRLGLAYLRMGRLLDATRAFRRAVELLPNNPDPKIQLADIYLGALLATPLSDTRRVEQFRNEVRDLANQLLKADPKSAHGLRYRGYCALSERRFKDAIADFRAANEISPHRPEIVLPLAQGLIADNQSEEAEKLARDLIEKHKSFGPIYDLLYLQYTKTNRLKEAEDLLKAKVANNPGRGEYLIQLAAYYYATQRKAEMTATLDRLTSDLKTFPRAYAMVGDFYRVRRDYDNAVRHYEMGAKSDPKQKLLYHRLKAQALIDQGKRNQAAGLLEQILKEDPKDAAAQAMRAALLIETGSRDQIQTAVTELQAMVARMPENPVLRYNLGRALLRKGEIEQARIQFEEAMKRQANYLLPRLGLAEIHLFKREFPRAAQAAREILDQDPANLLAKLIRVSALTGMGNVAQARAELEQTIKDHPTSREAMLHMALLDLADRKYKEAEATFSKLHQSAPADLRGLMGLTETYAMQNQFDKAVQLIRSELEKSPERAPLHLALANLAVRSRQYDLAVEEYRKLIASDPRAGENYLRLGEALRLKGDLEAAVETFRKGAELLPNHAAAHLPLAMLLDALHRPAEAKPIYERVLQLQPDNPIALNNLAYLLAETGADLDRALGYAQRAKQKLPQDPNVADTLGWIYIKKNLSDNAIEIFRELVQKHPDNSTFHYHLAMALYQKGDKPQARKQLEIALQKKPSAEETAKIKELLAKVS